MSSFKEFSEFDAIGLAELVRKREISSLELCEEAIERIERVNPQLNAVIAKLYDRAIVNAKAGTASGPFAGVPFLLKDLLSPLAGVPYTSGSRLYRNFVPKHDAEMVRRYKAAGFNIVGKTSTPEFGILPVTEPVLFGPCRNPWDLSRTPGGSSGGAAAMVASGVVPAAHGGDGGGSIRIPASCCGLFGLKPTRGRVTMAPFAGEAWGGFVQEHVIARSVRDSALLLDVADAATPGEPYSAPAKLRPWLEEVGASPGRLRIAFTRSPLYAGQTHPDCAAALDDAIQLLAALGHHVTEARPPFPQKDMVRAYFLTVATGVAR